MKGNENLIRHDSVFLILDLIGKTRFIYEIRKKHKLNILLYIFKRKTFFFEIQEILPMLLSFT